MKKALAAIAALCVVVAPLFSSAEPISTLSGLTEKPIVVALDRTQTLTGMNPQSTWINIEQRYNRIGNGAFWWAAFCGSGTTTCAGVYSNLTIQPANTLLVVVAPSSTNTIGTVYQFLPEETSPYGGYPSGVGVFLPPDPTQVMIQGQQAAGTTSTTIGPLLPPGTAGLSIDYLIEAQVMTPVDTGQTTINIETSGGSITQTQAPRDRKDLITYRYKAGVAATTGTQSPPSVDTGWVSLGVVAVPYGTTTLSSGMVTATPDFEGFIDGNTAQSINGVKTFNAPIVANGGLSSSGALQISANAIVSGAITTNGITDYVGYVGPTGAFANSASVNGGYLTPAYSPSGASLSATNHLVIGTVTASSASVTVSLTGRAAFNSVGVPTVLDVTSGNAVTSFTALGNSAVSWAATSGHIYSFSIPGY